MATSTVRFATPQEDWDAGEDHLVRDRLSAFSSGRSFSVAWKAVRVAFGATSGRATFWFLGAPLTVYVVSFGLLTIAGYALGYLQAAKQRAWSRRSTSSSRSCVGRWAAGTSRTTTPSSTPIDPGAASDARRLVTSANRFTAEQRPRAGPASS